MPRREGGTQMYCPECGEVNPCKVIAPHELPQDMQQGKEQKQYVLDHPDVKFFSRHRWCPGCDSIFETIEISSYFLEELVRLREKLSSLRDEIDRASNHHSATATSLRKLQKSFGK